MVSITFVAADGQRQTIEATVGQTLMASAKAKGVDGIEAECGGSMVCGTCHVYLDPAIYSSLEPVPAIEAEMLEYVIEPRKTSRLSCQIYIAGGMEGMDVGLPPSQR